MNYNEIMNFDEKVEFLVNNEEAIYSLSDFSVYTKDITIKKYRSIIIVLMIFIHAVTILNIEVDLMLLAFIDISMIIFSRLFVKNAIADYMNKSQANMFFLSPVNKRIYESFFRDFTIFTVGINKMSAYEIMAHLKKIYNKEKSNEDNYQKIKSWIKES